MVTFSSNIGKSEIYKDLEKIYASIPDTTGCMENICKENGCGAICCKCNSPQVLLVEFNYVWKFALPELTRDQVIKIIESSFRNYLSKDLIKTCVFWDFETKHCLIHKYRSFNCRTYGIIPEEEFSKRAEKLKANPGFIYGPKYVEQCKLVSIKGDQEFTKDDIDVLWKKMEKLEQRTGVPFNKIHDGADGSYRTYHDNVILRYLDDTLLSGLTIIKEYGDVFEKEEFIIKAMSFVSKKIGEKDGTE
ncbi:MAG: hypothetical protein WDA06_00490 [Phenylobacterium sp.]